MGMTPLEGLVMGTRCGDVDPAVPMLLGEITGRSREDVHRLMNSESGLLGLCGASDMREVHRLADDGDSDAAAALEMYCYRAKKYVGAYAAALGRIDALVFTGGVGENDSWVREHICAGLRSEEHTSELQSPAMISYAVGCSESRSMQLATMPRCATSGP